MLTVTQGQPLNLVLFLTIEMNLNIQSMEDSHYKTIEMNLNIQSMEDSHYKTIMIKQKNKYMHTIKISHITLVHLLTTMILKIS